MNWLFDTSVQALLAAAPAAEKAEPSAPGAIDLGIERVLLWTIDAGIFLIAAAIFLCIARIVKGPGLVDRGIAADTVAIQVAALVLLITIRVETLLVFDAVLIVSILGFVSTLAFAQYIGRRRSATA